MKKILFITLIILNFKCISQENAIFVGDNAFQSTGVINFKCKTYNWSDLSLSIGKKGNEGLAMVSVYTGDLKLNFIGGTLFLILDNGTIIKCLDTNQKDFVDEKSIAIFKLTVADINNLKQSNIQTIRFTIKDKPKCTSTLAGNYTADNSKNVETKAMIAELFK